MTTYPPFRKIFDAVATRDDMPGLRERHREPTLGEAPDGSGYAGEWFEVDQGIYDEALNALLPLFTRSGMFAMSEFKTENVTSVFFSIRIRTHERWFHGYCDLSDPRSREAMRAAIVAYKTNAVDSMTRDEKLERIWNRTPDGDRGYAGSLNPGAWPPQHRGKRTILVNGGGLGTILMLLEDLTDEQIGEILGEHRPPSANREGGNDDKSA